MMTLSGYIFFPLSLLCLFMTDVFHFFNPMSRYNVSFQSLQSFYCRIKTPTLNKSRSVQHFNIQCKHIQYSFLQDSTGGGWTIGFFDWKSRRNQTFIAFKTNQPIIFFFHLFLEFGLSDSYIVQSCFRPGIYSIFY